MSDKYTCAHCKGVFSKGWSDEEAEAELQEKFGEIPTSVCDIVCEDCYKRYMNQ